MEGSSDTSESSYPKIDKKRATLKDVMRKLLKTKAKEANHARILLAECMRDKLKISLEHCENLLKSSDLKDLRLARDPYTGQGLLHFWWTQGHLELFEPLLEREPDLVTSKDEDRNTPFHNLCSNTKSNEAELISMFNLMKKENVDIHAENSSGVTGLQILEKRVKESNPYDNVQSVKLFYQHVIAVWKEDSKGSEKRCANRSTYSSTRASSGLSKDCSFTKICSKKRNLSTRTRKSREKS